MNKITILFFTILFCNMCKAADLYTFGHFKYKIESETNKQICLYTFSDDGETTSLTIPSEIVHNNEIYTVTKINGPASESSGYNKGLIQNGCKINDIYFPSSLTYVAQVSRELSTLKYAIFENGDNITNYPSGIFYYQLSPFSLEYVIIFNYTKNNLQSTYLVGSSNKDIFIENKITISYKNGTTEAVSMFLYYVQKEQNTFDNTKFNYLISALQKRGTDLSTISNINLSSMDYKFSISFEDNPANMLPFGVEVITKKESYSSTNILDKVNFNPPTTNITENITYNRTNTHDWNSVCLPFDIKESDFGTSCKIYTISAATDNQINLTRVETSETVVEAGTPCFIHSSVDEWNLNLLNVTISSNVAPKTINVGEDYQVIGSFTNKTISAGNYKLNSEGTEFGITNSNAATVTAFRCYIAPTSTRTNAPAHLSVNIDEEASIMLVPNDAKPQKVKLYDLMGRPRKEGAQGIFIKSTR